MRARLALAIAACLALALLLSACGGGGGGGSSGTTATEGQTSEQATSEARHLPGHPKLSTKPPAPSSNGKESAHRYGTYTRASAKAAERRAARHQQAKHRRLAQKAGRAAPFLVPVGDNSIPTYGREAPASEQGQAEAALRSYLGARESGDWSAACAQMASSVQRQLAILAGSKEGAQGCPAAYAKLAERIPASARKSPLSGSLTAFREEGGKGFALWVGPREQQWMMPMVAEGGGWKVGQIEAVAWPVGSAPANSP